MRASAAITLLPIMPRPLDTTLPSTLVTTFETINSGSPAATSPATSTPTAPKSSGAIYGRTMATATAATMPQNPPPPPARTGCGAVVIASINAEKIRVMPTKMLANPKKNRCMCITQVYSEVVPYNDSYQQLTDVHAE